MDAAPLLAVRGLSVEYRQPGSPGVRALADVSFTIQDQEIVGVLGESGSGKSTLALSLLGLLSAEEARSAGTVQARGPGAAGPASLAQLRGHTIAAVFQEPGTSLNPVMPVGKQVAEILRAHRPWPWQKCMQAARATVGELFAADADRIFSSYPHQLSGGQRQRILIAQAIACQPAVLIADEPTASLDATVQMDILLLLKRLVRDHRMSLVLISHDPRVLAMMADRLIVMYAGRIVESGPRDAVLQHPKHPYTQALLQLAGREPAPPAAHGSRLPMIPGSAPSPTAQEEPGCAFHPRCPVRMEQCVAQSPPEEVQDGHGVRCFKYGR